MGDYFNSRRGKVGDVTGGGPEATYDLGFGAGPQGSPSPETDAPGTEEFARYGGADTAAAVGAPLWEWEPQPL